MVLALMQQQTPTNIQTMNKHLAIAKQFDPFAVSLAPLGNGLINDSYLVMTEASPFVLQRINRTVFQAPDLITANLLVLISHVNAKKELGLRLPGLLETVAGKASFTDEKNDFWRAQQYIDGTESLETLDSLAEAAEVGRALGHFHHLTSDLNPALMQDTLPGFHIAPNYLASYRGVEKPSQSAYSFCTAFIDQIGHITSVLETAKGEGVLPVRVTHGDPKLNNFLFDQHKNIVSLIDLDTVKPGLVHYDIGDCLRSCCHIPANDRFDLKICEAFLGAYLGEAKHFFTAAEYDFLYSAILLIPFELGLRFYTDYLAGNVYFKVSESNQNLRRATQQFRLCESIMMQATELQALVAELKAEHGKV
jgi:Ser/Thr protein kinase RdoA (MazF antagonist)